MTPIQQAMDFISMAFGSNNCIGQDEIRVFLKSFLASEKQFAKENFDAGQNYKWHSEFGKIPNENLNFDNYYKQFEQ